jgi:hypothetical protein
LKYRYKIFDGAHTLEAAIDKSLDAYNVLRGEILEHAQEVAINESQHEIKTSSLRRLARMIIRIWAGQKKTA